MTCNESVIYCGRWLYVVRHNRYRNGNSLLQKFNPLRYEFLFRHDFLPIITINRDGWLSRLV